MKTTQGVRTLCMGLLAAGCGGGTQLIDEAATADSTAQAVTNPGVTITSPGNGATVFDPVTLIATARENVAISQMQAWDNGIKLGWYPGSTVHQSYLLGVGSHTLTVEDLNDSYQVIHTAVVTFTVTAGGVTISKPTEGASVPSPVTVVASAVEKVPINQMQVWDNGIKLGWYAGAAVNQSYPLAAGSHSLTVEDLDNTYQPLHKTTVNFTVTGAPPPGVGPKGGSVTLLHFGATGDTRPGSSEAQGVIDYPSAIIDAIASQLKARQAQFVVDMGDHMNNWHDLTAAQQMMAKYQDAMNLYGGTWFMTMGNHECDVPYPINCIPFAGQPGATAVNFVTFLDALKASQVSDLPWYSFDVDTSLGLARFVVIADNAWCPEQDAWLKTTLTAADQQAKYTLVLRHHPPDDGGAPAVISQIVRQHKFALFMTGHAHMYQHLASDSGRDFILGTGGAPLQNVSGIPGAHAFNGYVVVDQQTDGQLRVTVYDSATDTQMDQWSVGPNP